MSKITKDFRVAALRNGIVVRPRKDYETPQNIRFAAVIEMANLGFQIAPESLEGMSTSALNQMIADARNVIGADRNMRPVYPGFPQQVESLDTLTLIVEQLLHYWTGGQFFPDYPDVAREGLPLEDMGRADRKVTTAVAGDAARTLISQLVTRGVALSDDERNLVTEAVQLSHLNADDVSLILSSAHNGENMQTLVGAVHRVSKISADDLVTSAVAYVKNVDQMLRVVLTVASTPVPGREVDYKPAVFMLSDKDATAVKMKTLSRPARKAILAVLGAKTQGFRADALMARQTLWRRVMRMVHPFSMREARDGSVRRALDIIHSNIEYRTLNSLVEQGMADGDVKTVVSLLAEHQPGNLLRRLVAILRLVKKQDQASLLAEAVEEVGANSAITTLISSYNGVISANDDHARLTRVTGQTNTMRVNNAPKVQDEHLKKVAQSVLDALSTRLARVNAPEGVVGTRSTQNVPLVRRDLATTDRVMDRGQALTPVGEGDTVRLFSHWINQSGESGYIDVGAVVLGEDFETLSTSTWNSWNDSRDWSTYSGDTLVRPGRDAVEYVDVNMKALKENYPKARWVAMTLQSWSGISFSDVDMIAGTMLRSKPDSGEPFDARTVTTAFRPTTSALQAVPLAVNLKTGEMLWLDSSSGSTERGVSAASDEAVGSVVYDEIARPRLTMGELATLWAQAHSAETSDDDVDRDAVLALLD